MKLEVYKLLKSDRITDYESGARLFNILNEQVKANPEDFEVIINFDKINVFTQVPFKTLISSMRSRLQGDYAIKLINQNKFITKSFENSI